MSNITLSPAILDAIVAPISTRTVAPIDADLLKFAKGVNNLHAAGTLADTFAPILAATTPVQTTPRTKAPVKARKSADKAAVKADWRNQPVSMSQIERTNRLLAALDAHYGERTARVTAADFANKGEASDYYKPLADEGNALNLRWAA